MNGNNNPCDSAQNRDNGTKDVFPSPPQQRTQVIQQQPTTQVIQHEQTLTASLGVTQTCSNNKQVENDIDAMTKRYSIVTVIKIL